MSILQLIELTRRSFETTTAAMNTIGQNIANEQTEGYKRRRIELRAETLNSNGVQITTPLGASTGLGVSLQSIDRIRDSLLSSSSWEARAGLGASDEESRLLSAIENLFPANTEGSIGSLLGNFWNAWSDVANNPSDLGIRETLLSKSAALTNSFNRAASDIDRLEDEATKDLESLVADFNNKLQQVADLNVQIRAQRANNTPDLTAEDERELIISELSEMAPIHVEIDELNVYNVTIHGMILVQGRDAEGLNLDTLASPPTLTFPGATVAFNPPAGDDGRIGAIMRTLTDTLPGVRQNLDTLVDTIVTRVNALHGTGYGLDGGTGRDFFDPTGLAAGTFTLSAGMSNAQFIAASDDPDPTAIGDNDIATAILNERTALQAGLGNQTVESFAISTVTSIGSQLEAVNGQYEGHSAVVNYLDALERGVSGVSVNDELTNLIQYQQSFGAAARVLTTVQSMMDTLLAI